MYTFIDVKLPIYVADIEIHRVMIKKILIKGHISVILHHPVPTKVGLSLIVHPLKCFSV